jgi:2,3-dihydroxybiphenyl 1,2-dioxygenase
VAIQTYHFWQLKRDYKWLALKGEGMSELQNLAYVVVEASDLAAWRDYAINIVGLAEGSGNGKTLGLRMDEHPWRILLEEGPADDLSAAGWDLGSEQALDRYADKLRGKGLNVTEADPGNRAVSKLYRTEDPIGFSHEFFYGRTGLDGARPATSPVVRGEGFVTGDLGIGHILPVAKDYDASVRWYQDMLGLRYSDRIRQEMAPGIYADATFFHTATGRHHSLATGAFPSRKTLNHLMLEYRDMSDVGAAFDRARAADVPIVLELGHHPNDRMFSFYMRTPSGFGLELGFGGIVIDDDSWEPQIYSVMSDWGHRRNMNMVD